MSKTTDGKSQTDRFIETARSLGSDEDEATFKAKLAVIARQKPKPKGETEKAKTITPIGKELRQLEAQLRKRLVEDCAESRSLGYDPKKFLGMVNADGPVKACIQAIASQRIPDGFINLLRLKRLDLTAEATVLAGPWRKLFDDTFLDQARKRLRAYERPDLALP
jgi:hypothetical protein